MSDTPIVKIPVSTEAWDAFLSSFEKFKSEAEKATTVKVDIATNGAKGSAAFQQAAQQANQARAAFTQNAASATATAVAAKQTGQALTSNQTVSAVNNFNRSSKQAAANWKQINRNVSSTHKWLIGISRMNVVMGAMRFLKAGIEGTVAAGAGAAIALGDLADKNKTARRLGVPVGEAQAFEDTYSPAGGSAALLERLAEAKANPAVGAPLGALGITQAQIQSTDLAKLAAMVLERGGQKFNEMGVNAGQYFEGTGLNSFLKTDDARLAGSYDSKWYAQQSQAYDVLEKKLEIDQKAADSATAFKQALDGATSELNNNFEKALAPLAPQFLDLVKATADETAAIMNSPFSKHVIDDVGQAMEKLANWIRSDFKLDFGDIKHDPTAPLLNTQPNGKPWTWDAWKNNMSKGGWFGSIQNRYSDMGGQGAVQPPAPPSGGVQKNGLIPVQDRAAYESALEQQYGLPAGMLDTVESLESARGTARSLIGPETSTGQHAVGPMQLMPDVAASLGVADPMDEAQSLNGGARLLSRLMRKYHDQRKALASYNWGEANVDRDVNGYTDKAGKRHEGHGADWLNFAPEETRNYVAHAMGESPLLTKASHAVSDFTARINEAAAKVSSLFRDGGGAGIMNSLDRAAKGLNSNQVAPANITLNINNRAGANVNVSGQMTANGF